MFTGVQIVYKMPVQVAVFSISIWLRSFFMVSGFSLVLRLILRMWPDQLKLECSMYLSFLGDLMFPFVLQVQLGLTSCRREGLL